MKLTRRQARFVDEYLLSGNAAAAARAAGYSVRSARQIAFKNMSKDDIQAALQARQQAQAEEMELTRQDVINALLGAIQTATEQGQPAVMITGWREIARMLGFYEPEVIRVEPMSGEADRILRQLESLPTSQLLEMAARKRQMMAAQVA
jgi:hypothetical protein